MALTSSMPSELSSALEKISPAHMWQLTKRLCDPTFAGRRVGTEGHARASRFLIQQLRASGWKVSTQEFPLTAPVLDLTAPLHLEQLASDGAVAQQFAHRTEFCEHPRSASHPGLISGLVVPPSGNVRDAWVALEAVPHWEAFTRLVDQLVGDGAVGVLTPLSATADGYLVKRIIAGAQVALPVLSVRTDLLEQLVGTRIQAWVPVVSLFPTGMNLIAHLEGTDKHYADAPLLIGAHYDGVGDDLEGMRLPGATDNAAAVAVLLALAQVFPSIMPPRRPLLLVAFDAEEAGAQGSRVLAHALKEQGKQPLVLNLDGAACRQEAVWVEPAGESDVLLRALDQAGRWLGIPLTIGTIASDHRQFAALGFPAVGLSIGAAKLHTPGDAMEQVSEEALYRAATLLLATCWQ